MKLEISRRAQSAWKNPPEMIDCLQQGIGVRAAGWLLYAAEPGAKGVQAFTQLAPQPIEGFQGERQPQLFKRGLGRKPRQQFCQPDPQQRGRQRVAGKNFRQTKQKSPSATAPPSPIGTKYPLPPERASTRRLRIVAQGAAVAV